MWGAGFVTADAISFGGYGVSLPVALLLAVCIVPMIYVFVESDGWFGHGVVALEIFAVLVLVVAAAQPFVVAEQEIEANPELVVLEDRSRSMLTTSNLSFDLEGVDVRRRVIASGNTSDLRGGIVPAIQENTTYILASDLRSSGSIDGISDRFAASGSTLYAVRQEMETEYAVHVNGPEQSVPGARNRFTVTVTGTTDSLPDPTLVIDGTAKDLVKADQDGVWTATHEFDAKGDYRIEATIDADDRYGVNNRDLRTVKVREKPEILVVGEEQGGLSSVLSEFYDLTYADDLPGDLSPYYAVVAQGPVDETAIQPYIIEGNGLVYTGDVTPSQSMDLLPVRPSSEQDSSEGSKIVLAIDSSSSIRDSDSATQRQKQLAFNLVELLPYNNRVGAVAYNDEAYVLQEPESLAVNRDELLDKIARIEPGGKSFHQKGIGGASKVLNGTGNIIWISDGELPPAQEGYGFHDMITDKSQSTASQLEERLVSVVVGDNEEGRSFMQDITDRAGGMQLDAENSGRLSFVFEAGGAASGPEGLVPVQDHFITEGLSSSGRVTLFDSVEPRRGAELLLTSTSGRPVLTSWRYGLGRVAAFSADTPDLSQLSEQDPSVITRTMAWAVGEPSRKEEKWVDVPDARWGEPVHVTANHPVTGLRRQAEGRYSADISVGSKGFHSFAGTIYAYSYPAELMEVGYSDGLKRTVRRTGGEVVAMDEIDELANDLSSQTRTVRQRVPVTTYFIVLALVLFVAVVGIRKTAGER